MENLVNVKKLNKYYKNETEEEDIQINLDENNDIPNNDYNNNNIEENNDNNNSKKEEINSQNNNNSKEINNNNNNNKNKYQRPKTVYNELKPYYSLKNKNDNTLIKVDLNQGIYYVPLEPKMKIHINYICKMILIQQAIYNGFFSVFLIQKKEEK